MPQSCVRFQRETGGTINVLKDILAVARFLVSVLKENLGVSKKKKKKKIPQRL